MHLRRQQQISTELNEQLTFLQQDLLKFHKLGLDLAKPELKAHEGQSKKVDVATLPSMQKKQQEEAMAPENFNLYARNLLSTSIESMHRNGLHFITSINELKTAAEINAADCKQLTNGIIAFHGMINADTSDKLLNESQLFKESIDALPSHMKARIYEWGEILFGSKLILLGIMAAYLAYCLAAASLVAMLPAIFFGICCVVALVAIGAGIAFIYDGLNPTTTASDNVKRKMNSLLKLFTIFNRDAAVKPELTFNAQTVVEFTAAARTPT